MRSNLGTKIKELRKERDWSQAELSNKSGINRSTIAYLETGRIAKPSAQTFLKLSRAFNIRPEELYKTAGYILDANVFVNSPKETPEEILDRLRVSISSHVPIYEDFPFHAGRPVEPVDYAPVVRDVAKGKRLEGYIVHGNCLEPDIEDGHIIIVDRDGQIDSGDVVACLVDNMLHLAKLRKIADELYLENNNGRMKLDEVQIAAPVVEVRRRLK